MIFRKKKPLMTLGRWVLILAVAASALLLLAGPGTRLGLWEFRFGFQLMQWAVYAGIGVGVLSLLLLALPKTRQAHLGPLLGALSIAVITVYVPYSLYQQARAVPRIHDITTDTEQVPAFVAIAPLRQQAPNPVAYPGPEVAEQQRAAYPEIAPYFSEQPQAVVFSKALSVVESLGWTLVDQSATEGRIEAFDTTFWFGFVDDVVIRIRSEEGVTRVDVRSKSRVGLSDVGKNAERIGSFLAQLDNELSSGG